MKRMKMFVTILVIGIVSVSSFAQENVGIGTTTPHASALLEMDSDSKGLLIPRVTLIGIANGTNPVNGPATGLLVYNQGGALTEGFYYWDGAQWVMVGSGGGSGDCVTLNEAYNCNGAGAGRIITSNAGAVEINLTGGGTRGLIVSSTVANSFGVEINHNNTGVGLRSQSLAPGNTFPAIQAETNSTGATNSAVLGQNTGAGYAVAGQIPNTATGTAAVYGNNLRTNGGYGVHGQGYAGVVGDGMLVTIEGFGVFGQTTRGVGVQGNTNDIARQGVVGINTSTYGAVGSGIGVMGNGKTGVWGQTTFGAGYGVFGVNASTSGVDDNVGVAGVGWAGVVGEFDATSGGGGYGVFSLGNFAASGTKAFVIDHPLDPHNKKLKHFSIESNEVLNMYRGTAILDNNGEAVVNLPEYFSSINIDFTYHLTPIGAPANLYIKEKIKENSFSIAGGNPEMEVSWIIYAQRNDLYMQNNPEVRNTEVVKRQTGKYIQPELYGQPDENKMFTPNIKTQSKMELISPENIKTGMLQLNLLEL